MDGRLRARSTFWSGTGHEPHRIIGAIHFGDLPPDNVHYSETLRTPAPWSDDFHIYGIEWSAERIAWYAKQSHPWECDPE